MLGKFKGFKVPRKDPRRTNGIPKDEEKTLKNKFCYKARSLDCLGCAECLFCPDGRPENDQAFKEWYKAKGKVNYA